MILITILVLYDHRDIYTLYFSYFVKHIDLFYYFNVGSDENYGFRNWSKCVGKFMLLFFVIFITLSVVACNRLAIISKHIVFFYTYTWFYFYLNRFILALFKLLNNKQCWLWELLWNYYGKIDCIIHRCNYKFTQYDVCA